MKNKKYTSFSFKPFNAIRAFLYGFILLLILFSGITKSFSSGVLYSLIINVIIVITYILTSYVQIKKHENRIVVTKFYDDIQIRNVNNIQTWWSYDFGIESPSINEGSHGKSAPISNKINCFIKLSSDHEDIYLYEQIYLGGKFPNNHIYLPNQIIDKSRTYRIWDVDKCIQKLDLNFSSKK